MNTTTNTHEPLDSFESALLGELRREVAAHPVTAPSPVPAARRPRRRRYAAGAITAAAASVAVALGATSLGGSPAYAVQTESNGDVVVTVHRLDDADGLEAALKAKGIDADVSYDPEPSDGTVGLGDPGDLPDLPPPGTSQGGTDDGPSLSHQGSGPAPDDPCGFAEGDVSPASLEQHGADWVLTIPADSPLQDRHLDLGTTADGVLTVAYEGDEPGSRCGLAQKSAPRP